MSGVYSSKLGAGPTGATARIDATATTGAAYYSQRIFTAFQAASTTYTAETVSIGMDCAIVPSASCKAYYSTDSGSTWTALSSITTTTGQAVYSATITGATQSAVQVDVCMKTSALLNTEATSDVQDIWTTGTYPLPVGGGGTGSSTAAGALANLGGAAISGAAFTGPVSVTTFSNSGGTVESAVANYGHQITPTADTPGQIELYGTNHANSAVPWSIDVVGNAKFLSYTNSNGTVIPSTALGTQGPAAGYVQLAPAPSGAGYLYQNGAGTYSWGSPSSSGTVTTSGSPVSPNVACFSASTAIGPCTSANIQTAIGASVYDAYGAAAARQANLNLAPGTYANGDMCTYASSGTLLNCNTAVPGAYTLPSQYKTWSCEPGLGDGLNAITAGTYLQSTCWNKTGATVTLTGVGCFTDNAGSSTLNAAGNTLGALLTGAVTCTSSLASGTQSSNVLLTNGDYIKFTFVADGTSKQTTFVVTGSY
jgi:hypothetical protein